MVATKISDDELLIVARIAQREGWDDLGRPPSDHDPRSLEEELAVLRFEEAVPRPVNERVKRIRIRIAMVVIALTVLGACWWVSPSRTAIGLIGAGLFSLVALRRSRRKAARPPAG
jgi:hypothetical protein